MSESEQLLSRLVSDVQAIRERLGSPDQQQSSVEISTSTRGYDIRVKAYASIGMPVDEAGDAAVDEYVRVKHLLEDQLMDSFAAQVKK